MRASCGRAIDLGVVHVEPDGQAAGGDGLAQAIQAGIQSLAGIELGVRDEPAGIVEDGVQKGLHLAAAGALDVGAEEHVGLPDLIAVFGFELLVRRGSEQLAFGEAALFEEAIQRGGGQRRVRFGPEDRCQFAQQGGAGAMRVFAFEAFDQVGELRGNGAGLAAVLARLGSQGLEAAVAVAERPIQQRIDGNRGALGIGDVVVAGGDLLGAAGEFAAGSDSKHQRGDQPVAEQGDFFGFGIHAESPCARTIRRERACTMQMLCVDAQVGGNAGRSAVAPPVAERENAGQPNRWARSWENRKRWAAIQPMDCEHLQGAEDEIRRRGQGATLAARAAPKPAACC